MEQNRGNLDASELKLAEYDDGDIIKIISLTLRTAFLLMIHLCLFHMEIILSV